MRPWIVHEVSYGHLQQHPYEVVVLPFGATEPHNLHLPYGTDVFEATIIGEEVCRRAHEQGAAVGVLPTIPYGTESNLSAFPLAMNVRPSTMSLLIGDLIESIAASGIRKIVLLNSHGGNDLKPVLREWYGKVDAHLFLCNWYQMVQDVYSDIFEYGDDHAGEMETSFALAYFPELVRRNADGTLAADEGSPRPFRFEALNRRWVGVTRPWHLLTTNTGCGNPHAASEAKGRQLMERICERLVPFLVELADSPLDDWFPFAKE